MRELVDSVKNFYLQEALSKQPSSELRSNNNNIVNDLIRYNANTQYEKDMIAGHTGKTHNIDWTSLNPPDTLSRTQRRNALHDVFHAHNYYLKNKTNVGDILKNSPISNDEKSGVTKTENKREQLYKRAANFSDAHADNNQYGIVKQYPDDHPEEHMRGQKYLHPVSQKDSDLYEKGRYYRNSSPEQRMTDLANKTKDFNDKLEQQKKDPKKALITQLQPKKLFKGEDHLSTAQYTRNSERSAVGKGLDGNKVNDEKNDRMFKLKRAINKSNVSRIETGRVSKEDIAKKTNFDKNHLEMAQRLRNMSRSNIGANLTPVVRYT